MMGNVAYKIPMLMAMATPIFSLLNMLNLRRSRQGSKASAKSQKAEQANPSRVNIMVTYAKP